MPTELEVVVSGKKYVVKRDRRYTRDHLWVKVEDGRARIGLTDYGQDVLKDVVGVELPEPGRRVGVGEVVASIEGLKTTTEVYTPLSGVIASVNERLVNEPELINTDPYGDGWLFEITGYSREEYEKLLSPEDYIESLKQGTG